MCPWKIYSLLRSYSQVIQKFIFALGDWCKVRNLCEQFDWFIHLPGRPNKNGRKEILAHFLDKVKHSSVIDFERLGAITLGLSRKELEIIVNLATIRAVQQGHEHVDTR